MRLALVMLSLASSSCVLDWDRFDPRRADGAAILDVIAAESGLCGDPGQPCCSGGSCQTGSICTSTGCMPCPAGQIVCGGACVDVRVSNDHCGRCNAVCRGMRVCVAGACQ